ncbi:MAG: thioredoxin-disulfide reductase [Chloroflexi bacterium]|nr:thioredoxin-disulfide reductase [Chloroflexota bacterium]
MSEHNQHRQVVIIGSGPAGWTAALYAARADLHPLVLAGYSTGGQLMLTSDVENFPGYPQGTTGPELMQDLRAQAERFGAEVLELDATAVDFHQRPFRVTTDEGEFLAESVIIATGASAKWIGVPGEEEYRGKGVSACATCDGFFFRGKKVVVVGGGDTALEEALFLTRYATAVSVIHRRDTLRATKVMQQRAFSHSKISFIWNTVVEEILGSDNKVTAVRLRNLLTKEVSEVTTDGVFVAIGHEPNTKVFAGQIDLDAAEYIIAPDPSTTYTNVPGVFAAGDVRDHRYRQAVTAAGEGCKAAIDAERWLDEQGIHRSELNVEFASA